MVDIRTAGREEPVGDWYENRFYKYVSKEEAIEDFRHGAIIDGIDTYNAGTYEDPFPAMRIFYRTSKTWDRRLIEVFGTDEENLEGFIADMIFMCLLDADKELREISDIVERVKWGGL